MSNKKQVFGLIQRHSLLSAYSTRDILYQHVILVKQISS